MTLTTKISKVGAVEIPASMREANGWTAGMELEVEARGAEIVLRSAALSKRAELFPPITMEEFLARVPKYTGPSVTLEMMDEAVLAEAKRRWHAKGS